MSFAALVAAAERARVDSRDVEGWLSARYLLAATGNQEAALIARAQAAKCALTGKPVRGRHAALVRFRAALDLGDLGRASRELSKVLSSGAVAAWLPSAYRFVQSCTRGTGFEVVSHEGYSRLVSGGPVALVGPTGQEADVVQASRKYNVIVRISPKPGQFDVNGAKVDAGYYNLAKAAAALEQRCQVHGDRWMVVKGASRRDLPEQTRVAEYPRWLGWGGIPLMAPVVVFDLIASGSDCVHVTNCDFYTGAQRHAEDYWQSVTIQGRQYTLGAIRSMAEHDVFDGIRFFRLLRNAGLLTADVALGRVLDAEDIEIARQLDSLYPSDLGLVG